MEEQPNNVKLHKLCVDRIEEMYNQNKDIYKIYQEVLQKNIYIDSLNKKLMIRLKEKEEIINKWKDHVCECTCKNINTNKTPIQNIDEIVKNSLDRQNVEFENKYNTLNNELIEIKTKYNKIKQLDISIKDHPEIIKLKKEKEDLQQELNNQDTSEVDELKEKLKLLRKQQEEYINTNSLENNLKKVKNKIQDTPDSENVNKDINDFFNKNIKYKVIILKETNTKTKIKIGRRTYEFLNFYKELYDTAITESNDNFDSLDDCVNYILTEKGIKSTPSNKSNWKRTVTRCNEIFNLFKEKLIKVYYNINNIRYIKDEYWEQWKEYLQNKINENKNDIDNNISKESIINKIDYSEDLKNNILYKCKNTNCDDDVKIEDNYCDYCKKDLKKCRLCNIDFVNDELNVYNCEDCKHIIENEGYYESDEEQINSDIENRYG